MKEKKKKKKRLDKEALCERFKTFKSTVATTGGEKSAPNTIVFNIFFNSF